MVALAGGLAAFVLGVIGIFLWWEAFLHLLMGAVPVMLILGGALAAYLGFEEIKDKKAAESFDDSGSGLKSEVDSLKREIEDLKAEKKKLEDEGASAS
ncbi:conserved hypothetical protein [uncultured Desulfatiglans sp.]|nr:conserved hypothetical protein [uncultured Desulfatiglans sp.]